ncbi:MAG: DNA-processing protein DprA [Prevotellaceae bacterium]|jgi:DNA processing protein|nr:DNA-processing protein DprA [Prevotellaceae bacterium]
MLDENIKYKIGITLIKGIGNGLAKNLIAYVGSAEAVFREKRETLAKIPGIGEVLSREIVNQDVLRRAEKEIEFIEKYAISTHYYLDKNYPYRLKECPDAPILLFTKGNIDLNNGKFVGIVGTRNATEMGKTNCKNLVEDLGKSMENAVIVSGLAYGIDICSHKTAVENNIATIGVLGHGLDRIYPAAHQATAHKMVENGALLTEYLSETIPNQPNFVQRNRIVAGLCDVLVVVETKQKGGSLITACCANDYNRDVFAFPYRVTDEQGAGCNDLIKRNEAALIENAADLLNFMDWEKQTDTQKTVAEQTTLFLDLSEDEQALLHALRQAPDGLQINELAIKVAKSVSRTSALLLTLEFAGFVNSLPGNLYKIQ